MCQMTTWRAYQAYFHLYLSPQSFLSVRNLPSASPSRLHSGGLLKFTLSLAKENAATRRFSSLPTLYLYSFKENLLFYSGLLPLSFYIDPSLTKTVFTVLHKILISSAIPHFLLSHFGDTLSRISFAKMQHFLTILSVIVNYCKSIDLVIFTSLTIVSICTMLTEIMLVEQILMNALCLWTSWKINSRWLPGLILKVIGAKEVHDFLKWTAAMLDSLK